MRRQVLVLGIAVLMAGPIGSAMGMSHARAAAGVQEACAAIGLNPSEAPFAYCVRSLLASASRQDRGLDVPTAAGAYPSTYRPGFTGTGISHNAASACAAVGIDPRTARFSYCVTNLNAALFPGQGIDTAQ